jgi:hypothetical protein
MRIAGEVTRIPTFHAEVDGATLRLPRGTRLTHGLAAVQLPPGVAARDIRLAPALLADGLDLANGGAQYGDTVYVRNLTGLVLSVEELGTATVERPAADVPPPPIPPADPAEGAQKAARRAKAA